jgi:hypothetical protein
MKYYHDLQTTEMTEARKEPTPVIEISAIYYLTFRIKVANASWYHHSVLLANTSEEFHDGTRLLQDTIRDVTHPNAVVSLIFVRILFSEDKMVYESASGQNIFSDIEAHLSSNRVTDNDYLVFGLVGDESYRMTLMNLQKPDALSAVSSGENHIRKILHEPFSVLDVYLINPVTYEFFDLYKSASARIKQIVDVPLVNTLMLH